MPAQPEPTDRAEVQKLANAVEDALAEAMKTSYRDDRPLPVTGDAPPVPQPGRPPMSSKATDDSVRMLTGSVLVMAVGGSASLVLWASGYADPTVLAWIAAAPVGVAAPILALARLMRRAGDAIPAEHHHHYGGPVHNHNQNVHNQSRLWGKSTTNM